MKIYKSQYGWSTSAHSKNVMGEQIKCYVDVNFKKGEEPLMESIEGKLIFREDDGSERECFLSSYEKRMDSGKIMIPKIIMMGKSYTHSKKKDTQDSVQTELNDGKKSMFGKSVEVDINPEELPFY